MARHVNTVNVFLTC